MKPAFLLALPILLIVSACEETGETDPSANQEVVEASGDVLGGSISDDMIPLDELQSQSPPAERSASACEESGSEDATSE
ncbi:MAG: hypothetical protein AAGK01_07005 [Pseudomonadota bacterium]